VDDALHVVQDEARPAVRCRFVDADLFDKGTDIR
jgi:hypothetical protein